MNIVLVFSSFGPYHHARALALRRACEEKGYRLIIAAMTAPSLNHQWSPETDLNIHVLCQRGSDGDVSLKEVIFAWSHFLKTHKPAVVVIAGYWPASIALLSFIAFAKGIPRILMTESHAATAKRTGIIAFAKRLMVRSFSAAVVGGKPHAEYLMSLGFDPKFIRDGYDCVDNELFERESAHIRETPQTFRIQYGLPEDFFLTVARLVPKKNIGTLITAYSDYRNRLQEKAFDLVIVGDGELAATYRAQCASLAVPVRDAALHRAGHSAPQLVELPKRPTIHFYGSRRINELPVFFALARAFVLPSVEEEWGLVVNEAMASGCPVLLSERAGCARDLVPDGHIDQTQRDRLAQKAGLRSSGVLFNPTSPNDLANALELMTFSRKLRELLAMNGRKVIGRYDSRRFGKHTVQLIELVCSADLQRR
jgi:1,2-diacylglycerol 3-alpha-glucosyltransferase